MFCGRIFHQTSSVRQQPRTMTKGFAFVLPYVLSSFLFSHPLQVTSLIAPHNVKRSTFPLVPSVSTTTSPSQLFMSTWSDARAVRDYQDFLSSGKQELELASDVPSVIVTTDGPTAQLANWLREYGTGEDVIVTPNDPLPETLGGSSEFPVYVVIPPYYLNYFLENLSDSYKMHMDDFVFFSGGLIYGNIEEVLKQRGFCRDAMTQVVISGLHIAPNGRGQDLSGKYLFRRLFCLAHKSHVICIWK